MNFRELTHEGFIEIQRALPKCSFVDASMALVYSRMIKDSAEIQKLVNATRIASQVAEKIPELVSIGMTELELAAEIEYQMGRAGASGRSFNTIVAFGASSAEPHHIPQNRQLRHGAGIVCDFGAVSERYASDITRSYHVRPRDTEMQQVHATVEEAQRAALALVRDGALGRDVFEAAERVIDHSPWRGRFTHGVGHSIGLEAHDGFYLGDLSGQIDDCLKEGMVITIEPGIYLPGRGGVRIEDDVLVTRSGYRLLTQAPRGYIEVLSLN